jgi:hypothetical protein
MSAAMTSRGCAQRVADAQPFLSDPSGLEKKKLELAISSLAKLLYLFYTYNIILNGK